jgi:radical SAM superfamily enzyme YgiQ (UPF0313 family)
MPHVTYVQPAIGTPSRSRRARAWQFQPLAMAALAAVTPSHWKRTFFDDRQEAVAFDSPTDLAAIAVETFTARRAYELADEFRRRGVPVAMGGYHPTIHPAEALRHADAVCVGDGEPTWPRMLEDAERGALRGIYGPAERGTERIRYDRSIFDGHRYLSIGLVETGRGCSFRCAFCSVTAFHRARHTPRPIEDVVADIRGMRESLVMIVDDNVIADTARAHTLFAALAGAGKRWLGQATVTLVHEPALMDAMAASGCMALLLGFESFCQDSLRSLDKKVNMAQDYREAVAALRRRGIAVYGTFMVGLPEDSRETVRAATRFVLEEKLFLASFNHAVPYPGTPLYARLQEEGRLTRPEWWLEETSPFAEAPFRPWAATGDEVREWCRSARAAVYSWRGILRRAMDLRANCKSPRNILLFLSFNFMLHLEVFGRKHFPVGVRLGQGADAPKTL